MLPTARRPPRLAVMRAPRVRCWFSKVGGEGPEKLFSRVPSLVVVVEPLAHCPESLLSFSRLGESGQYRNPIQGTAITCWQQNGEREMGIYFRGAVEGGLCWQNLLFEILS